MTPAQEHANKCVARVHSLGNSYLDIPKWRFLKRWLRRRTYRLAVYEAQKACFDDFVMIPEADGDGFFFERLNRIETCWALCGLY